MNTKLIRIAEIAKSNTGEKFTSLADLLSVASLKQCHNELEENTSIIK